MRKEGGRMERREGGNRNINKEVLKDMRKGGGDV